MPTVTERPIEGLASCRNPRCSGYKQQPVQAISTLTEFSYFDLGGDVPGIERAAELIRFADPDTDEACPACGEPRLVSDQTRPIYPNVSGVAQDALLAVQKDAERMMDMQLTAARQEAEMAQMRALMERQAAALDRQEAVIAELQQRPRGPGRPRKPEGE